MLGEIGLRLSAGWTSFEIARHFNANRPTFHHVVMPKNFTSSWVNSRVRELARDMRESVES